LKLFYLFSLNATKGVTLYTPDKGMGVVAVIGSLSLETLVHAPIESNYN